jgi:para-nitrobenzyl esterase
MRLSAQRTGTQHLIIGEVLSKLNPNAQLYPYFFSHWTPDRQAELHWTWHSGELWYFFNSMRTGHPTHVWRQIDYNVGDWASTYWANFMRTGDPNGSGLPTWYKASEGKLMDLGNNNASGNVDNVFVAKQGINEGTKKAPMDAMMRKSIIASQNLTSYITE